MSVKRPRRDGSVRVRTVERCVLAVEGTGCGDITPRSSCGCSADSGGRALERRGDPCGSWWRLRVGQWSVGDEVVDHPRRGVTSRVAGVGDSPIFVERRLGLVTRSPHADTTRRRAV